MNEKRHDPGPLASPGPPAVSRAAYAIVAAVAFACVALSVSYKIYDPDIWQHLGVGRAIWELHSVPLQHLWTWPSYGQPEVMPSWLFRALLWPWYAAGEFWGIQAWRWVTTLGAFAILLVTARRMGARGLAPLVVIVLCALVYRQRSMARPETLVAVLLAMELWILEGRRSGRRGYGPWVAPLLWIWTNAHISFPFGFAILGLYSLDDVFRRRSVPGGEPRGWPLWTWMLAAMALALVNPFGLGLLLQPVDFLLHQSHELLFAGVAELRPVDWSLNIRNGLPALVVGWPLLAALRPGRRPLDLVEWGLIALFTWYGLSSQRFLGFYSLVAVPFVSRHLDDTLARLGERRGGNIGWPRAAAVTVMVCAALSAIELSGPAGRLGLGFDLRHFPVAATDFMQAQGIRGRGFNYYPSGGWIMWRFWPDRSRLPFIDVHLAGTREDRKLYYEAIGDAASWHRLDDERHFDWALLQGAYSTADPITLSLESDTTWALVFVDDAASLFVRRQGPMAALADRLGYRVMAISPWSLAALGPQLERDTTLRHAVGAELQRAAASSPLNGSARSLLANLAILERRWADARHELELAHAVTPGLQAYDERLGMIAMHTGHPQEALAHYQRELARGIRPGLEFRRGQALQALGDWKAAQIAYAKEVTANPNWPGAKDSLAAAQRATAR